MSDPVYPPLSPLKTGLRARCPRCGEGPVFKGYLSLRESCPKCGLDYSFADPAAHGTEVWPERGMAGRS